MNFYTQTIMEDPRFNSTEECRDLALLEPNFRVVVQSIVEDAKALGIWLLVTETYRSVERQLILFNQGATQLKNVGVHHYGLAADFCKIIDGKASWIGDWGFLCTLAAKHGVVCGGNWGQPMTLAHTFRDYVHVQSCTLEEQNGLFAGTWYPTENANT